MQLNLSDFKAFQVEAANNLKGGAFLCFGGDSDTTFGTCFSDYGDLYGWNHVITEDPNEGPWAYHFSDCTEISVSCDVYNSVEP